MAPGKPKPKAKQAPKKQSAASKPTRKPGPLGVVAHQRRPEALTAMLHPRLNAQHLATPSLSATPYVVVRDKITVSVTPDATVHRTVIMVGAYNGGSDNEVSTTYGIIGSGTSVPGGAGDARIYGVNYTDFTHAGRMRVHRIGVRVVNTGATTAGAIPDGKFWIGTLRGHVTRQAYVDYNQLGLWLIGRNEMREYSNYAAFTSAKTAVCAPYDFLDWESFKGVMPTTPANAKPADTLSQVCIVLGPVKSAQSFDIQLDVELTAQFTTDPLMQSLAKHHPAVPDSMWHAARRFVSEHTPVLEDAAMAAGALALGPEAAAYLGGREAVGAAARVGGRALRAIAM